MQTCNCFSGYSGSNCIIDSRGSCAPLPPADPHETAQGLAFSSELSSIVNGVATLSFVSPATAGRVVDLSVGQCRYPEDVSKSFDEATCSDVYTLTKTLQELFEDCNFGKSQAEFTVLEGTVSASIVDQVATFQGIPITRTIYATIELDISLPRVLQVTADNAVISFPSPFAFITEQQYVSVLDKGTVTLSMGIDWPYSFDSFAITATEPSNLFTDFGYSSSMNTDQCVGTVQNASPCLTLVTIDIFNIAASAICTLNGTYSLTYNVLCTATGCPFASAPYMFNFVLVSDQLCSSQLIATQLGCTIETFTDENTLDPSTGFMYGDTVYMRIVVSADIQLDGMDITHLTISQDGGAPVDVLLANAAVSPLDTTIVYQSIIVGTNMRLFSFVLSTGAGSEFLLAPGAYSQVTFAADIEVVYSITGKGSEKRRKRDTRTPATIKARKAISLVGAPNQYGAPNAVLMNQNH